MVTSDPTINTRMLQNIQGVPSPGKSTFMPKMPVITNSGSIVVEMIVSTRSTSFCWCEMTDSLVDSRASTTSL